MVLNIEKLNSIGEELEWEGDKFMIKPMSVREQALFAQYIKKEQLDKATEIVFVSALKSIDASLREEDILNIRDKDFVNKVTKIAMKVNGFEMPKDFQQSNQDDKISSQQ